MITVSQMIVRLSQAEYPGVTPAEAVNNYEADLRRTITERINRNEDAADEIEYYFFVAETNRRIKENGVQKN